MSTFVDFKPKSNYQFIEVNRHRLAENFTFLHLLLLGSQNRFILLIEVANISQETICEISLKYRPRQFLKAVNSVMCESKLYTDDATN